MLATAIHGLRGTPYIYQGEELGMTNAGFTKISQYRDVESLNHFRILQEKGLSADNALRILGIHSRDNARTHMQWNDGRQAGFTKGEPWMEVNPNYRYINAQTELRDEDSIFYYYRRLIGLRKQYDVIAYGDIRPVAREDSYVFAYKRTWKDEELLVICNFYGRQISWKSEESLKGYEVLLGNYGENCLEENGALLKPYECLVLYRKRGE